MQYGFPIERPPDVLKEIRVAFGEDEGGDATRCTRSFTPSHESFLKSGSFYALQDGGQPFLPILLLFFRTERYSVPKFDVTYRS